MDLDGATVADVVRRTLDEDLGPTGDVTAKLCVPGETRARAVIVARAAGVVAGVTVAERCFQAVDPNAQVRVHAGDGSAVGANDLIMEIHGSAAGLVGAERSALNFMQRLSGIATRTRAFVDAVAGTGAEILDTRKTTPGLRALEKYAVRVGGGCNHRFGLFDQVLIKENHFALASPESLEDVARRAVEASDVGVVAEARDLEEALAVVRGGVAVVLLDNFQPGDELKSVIEAVRAESSKVSIEVSGGVVLESVRAYAECGVDRISVGSLTHSVPALDLSMLVEEDS